MQAAMGWMIDQVAMMARCSRMEKHGGMWFAV